MTSAVYRGRKARAFVVDDGAAHWYFLPLVLKLLNMLFYLFIYFLERRNRQETTPKKVDDQASHSSSERNHPCPGKKCPGKGLLKIKPHYIQKIVSADVINLAMTMWRVKRFIAPSYHCNRPFRIQPHFVPFWSFHTHLFVIS